VSSAFSMGGVAIWCMHYIGNRAIVLYGGQNRLQLSYSAGFTVLSFFMPVVVLLLAYIVIGGVENPAIWRLLVGGTFAGAAICGMHYLVNTPTLDLIDFFRANCPLSITLVHIMSAMSSGLLLSRLLRQ
jgi:NO-binding membrane sensor protein with MHYT domain